MVHPIRERFRPLYKSSVTWRASITTQGLTLFTFGASKLSDRWLRSKKKALFTFAAVLVLTYLTIDWKDQTEQQKDQTTEFYLNFYLHGLKI